jgi:hypothetical protein
MSGKNKGTQVATLILVGLLALYYAIDLSPPQRKFAVDQKSTNPALMYADICDELDRCVRYAQARRECATAGNIDECVKRAKGL